MTDPRSSSISADHIADTLGRPRPTAQQKAVIESPLAPALVVAGAGSGKTETMANRVLWLLANGLVRPSEVLGLTFTRKASAELAARIRRRIAELAAAGLLPHAYDDFEIPTVATYNSFANLIYRDNAILLGREGDGAVLGEAAAWQLARSTVLRSADTRLPDLGKNLDQLTAAVLAVSRSLAENVADPEAVRDLARHFVGLAELPAGHPRYDYAKVTELAGTIGSLDVLVDLAAEFDRAKLARGVVEYSDQVALGLQVLRKQPRVRDDFRDRFKVVLLDEYQDTSVVQAWLLAELFAGHPVMAVGDPNQSIYGWRGASAANLDQFAESFGATGARFALSTSWRNGRRILEIANAVVEPLAVGSRIGVERLVAAPTATSGAVAVRFHETVIEEADAVAGWLEQRLAEPGEDGGPPTAALLFRTRKMQPFFLDALRARGIRFHVLGIGGITAEPEIADLVSALTVVHDPDAGIELVRLLAGSRWRVGVQDLHALSRLASWLRDRDLAQRPVADDVRERWRASVADGEGGSIVDALDFLGTAPAGHTALQRFSTVGLERMRDAARLFSFLRMRSNLELPDFVSLVEQSLQLDIEVAANDYRALGGANLDAFHEAVNGYLAVDDLASLGGFLAWLREAEQREDLSPRPEDPEPGTVQVLTIHGAKGLEWDAVVVPRMVDDELPGRPREGFQGWLSFGRLPWPFRGDAAELPRFEWERAVTRKEVLEAQKRFSDDVRSHAITEERRLAYVAITRARSSLLLSGSFWATQQKPRLPSAFLRELERLGAIGTLPLIVEEVNPLGEDLEQIAWPLDPLGSRRADVEAAAAAVTDAAPQVRGPWSREVHLLLAERNGRLASADSMRAPDRIPASRFKDYLSDPAAVAAALKRPMPERPYRATRLGTLFHAWVEERYGTGGSGTVLGTAADDAGPGFDLDSVFEADPGFDRDWNPGGRAGVGAAHRSGGLDEFGRLRAIFEQSPWADLRPLDVECEIHLPFDGRIVVCKIDAVYLRAGRYQIVDWKTGKAPRDAEDLEQRQLQLALYRLAYSRWKDIDPDLIDAVFYFVGDDRIIAPDRLFSEDELIRAWRAAVPG